PEKELHIYIHDEAPNTINLQGPRGYNDTIAKKAVDQYTDLVQRSEIDCVDIGGGHNIEGVPQSTDMPT
ncbi:MAG: hypothetical protein ACKPKO_63735, partial [Candidatus Fonsibacter sp.]